MVNKKLRIKGKEYVLKNKQGNIKRSARKLYAICNCTFGRSCKKVIEEKRNDIFNMFLELHPEKKKFYVRSLVKYEMKKKCYVQGPSRRQRTFYYYLQIDNEKIKVCKKMFINTLGIKERTTKQKNDHEKKNFMNDFINSVAKLPSHYWRSDTKKLFLEENFKNKTELYEL